MFFYAADTKDRKKHVRARELISETASSNRGVVSSQVIQEFAANALKKLHFGPDSVSELCEVFRDFKLVKIDSVLVDHALNMVGKHSLSFWDACIIAAAQDAGCRTLYTEDLQHGYRFGVLKVVNPFA